MKGELTMKITDTKGKYHYYDTYGIEIQEGDIVLMNGQRETVYLTECGELGTDSTNPIWIRRGWAYPCEYGIYPFNTADEAIVIERKGETL